MALRISQICIRLFPEIQKDTWMILDDHVCGKLFGFSYSISQYVFHKMKHKAYASFASMIRLEIS